MIKFIGTAQKGTTSLLYYSQSEGKTTHLNKVESSDGYEFSENIQRISVVDANQKEEKKFNWKNLRISKQEDRYFLTYKLDSKSDTNLYGAVTEDLINFEKTGKVDHIKETGVVVPDYKFRTLQYLMYFGEKDIHIAYSSYLYQWTSLEKPVLKPRKDSFDSGDLEVGNVYKLGDEIHLIYFSKNKKNGKNIYSVGAAAFEAGDPTKLLWRLDNPIWETPEEFYNENLKPLGAALHKSELILYFLVGDNNLYAVSCPLPQDSQTLKNKHFSTIFKKAGHNPIISPNPKNAWESRATFNSAAIYEDGRVHFLYRALGDKDLSVLGYATSEDGLTIDFRSDEPVYIPREPFETPGGHQFGTFAEHFASGGGYGGIEDPRITRVENTIYLTYVAFDGANPPRAAISSIDVNDFRNKKWNKWAKPKLISAPSMVNKSAVVFPRKVKGKYVVMHRVYPNILIDYLDDLDFNDYLQGHYFIPPRKKFWDSKKVGAGAPPMETKDGWLLIYQSVGHQEPHKYKIGAMLLDKDNPAKVLRRTSTPIIEPNENYENDGFKAGVVYPCGAVIMNNNLHVYYGGADTVVCAASTEVDRLLYDMKHDIQPTLKKVKSAVLN